MPYLPIEIFAAILLENPAADPNQLYSDYYNKMGLISSKPVEAESSEKRLGLSLENPAAEAVAADSSEKRLGLIQENPAADSDSDSKELGLILEIPAADSNYYYLKLNS